VLWQAWRGRDTPQSHVTLRPRAARSSSRSLSQGGSHEDEEREGDGGKDIYDSDSGEAELNPNGCSFTPPNLSH